MAAEAPTYPLRFDIEYPEKLSRLLIFVKLIFAIPVYLMFSLLSASIPFAAFFAILFRKKYPRWWFDYSVSLLKFQARFFAYVLLLRDEYPAFEEEQAVHLEVDHPSNPNRWLPLVKWILALPHYLVLYVLYVLGGLFVFIGWFAILLTGRFPKGLFNFVVGSMRWYLRVMAYTLYLYTDDYPPFSMK